MVDTNMGWSTILYPAIAVFSVLIAPLIYIWRQAMLRIENLESKVNNVISRPEVETEIKNSLDPLKEDITDIKELLNKVLDHLINGRLYLK